MGSKAASAKRTPAGKNDPEVNGDLSSRYKHSHRCANDKKERRLLLHDLVSQGHLLLCCPISVAEVYAGMRLKEERKTEILLKSLQYYPIAFSVARLAGLMKRDYSRRGKTLNITDATIAAVAIHYRLPLITDNTKNFPMHEL